jgi:Bacterial Ig domain/RTX calcium-binding nonapeptide repeat (4 copies)/Haemolysin-type calcium binding protein related domain
VDADGDVLSNIENVTGSEYVDTLDGDTGANILSGGGGDDILNAGGGNDTYFFNSGDGRDEINDYYSATTKEDKGYWMDMGDAPVWHSRWVTTTTIYDGGDDILQFGAGVAVDDLAFELSGADLYIGVRSEVDRGIKASALQDHVRILDWKNRKNAIETIAFDDGSSVEIADVAKFAQGSTRDDTLDYSASSVNSLVTGFDGNDKITTGAGEDILLGGRGDDTLTGGDGIDVLIGGEGDDVIIGGNGGDILLEGGGNDAAIYSDIFGNYSTVEDALAGEWTITHLNSGSDGTDGVNGIEQFEFADGVMDDDGVFTAAIEGGLINSPTDTVARGTLSGGDGQTAGTLMYSLKSGPANGTVVINEDGTYSYTPDASFMGSDSFTYRFVDELGTITVGKMAVEIYDDPEAKLFSGTAGNDVLIGSGDNDTLAGGVGDDVLLGGTGFDVALFSGLQSAYDVALSETGRGWTVTDLAGSDGTDMLEDIERLEFGDGSSIETARARRVNTETADRQLWSESAGLSNGGYVVTWTSYGQDGSSGGIYGQRYSASGSAIGDEFQVNSYTSGGQYYPSVTGLADGGFFVTWYSSSQDGSSFGIYGQRFDADGDADGAETRINEISEGNQSQPAVALLADGGYVVAWRSPVDGDGYGIAARRYDAAGAAVGSEFRVNSTITGDQTNPSVAGLADGGFVIGWQTERDGEMNVYSQVYGTDGMPVGPELMIDSVTFDHRFGVEVAALSDGGYMAVWSSDDRDGSGTAIIGQRFDGSGAAVGSDFVINSHVESTQIGADVVGLAEGGAVVVWQSWNQDGDQFGIFGQEFAADGSAVGAEFQVNEFTGGRQQLSSLAALGSGGFVVSWDSDGEDGDDYGIYSRQYGGTGQKITGGSGDDTLIGGSGGDTLAGGVGDDVLVGSGGADRYSFTRGDGQDVIDDYAADGESDTLLFEAGIDHDQLWFEKTGNDMLISVIGSGDQITVENWYASSENEIERMESGDGQVADIKGVEALVSAMASFSPPVGGETDLSDPTYNPLDSALAANWQAAA